MKRIFDKTGDCACNREQKYQCTQFCRCYCHIPIWYRNIVWKLQDLGWGGVILVVLFMGVFQPFISFYLFLINTKNQKGDKMECEKRKKKRKKKEWIW